MNTLNARLVPNPVQDLVLLAARVGLGVVLIAHGWQKRGDGISATAEGFDAMGIPAPEAAAYFATYVELIGGALLIAGLLTPLVGLLVAGNMGGAFWFAHRDSGILSSEGGFELVAVIGLLALVVAAVGPGRLSIDHFVASGRRTSDPVDLDDRTRVTA